MKYRFGGKEKRLAFGVYPLISLASARETTRLAKLQLIEGKDLGEIKKTKKLKKQVASANTFAVIADKVIKKREIEGAACVTLDKLKWIIEQKLSPFINTLVSEITSAKLFVPLRQSNSMGYMKRLTELKELPVKLCAMQSDWV